MWIWPFKQHERGLLKRIAEYPLKRLYISPWENLTLKLINNDSASVRSELKPSFFFLSIITNCSNFFNSCGTHAIAWGGALLFVFACSSYAQQWGRFSCAWEHTSPFAASSRLILSTSCVGLVANITFCCLRTWISCSCCRTCWRSRQ